MPEVRLIDAIALMKRVCEKECGPHFDINLCDLDDDSTDTRCVFRDYVRAAPTIEAAPVRRGRWEDCSNGWMCSECTVDSEKDYNFCPNCGAKMDGEDTNVLANDGGDAGCR